MSLWRMIRGMFGHRDPPVDPAVTAIRADSEAKVSETHELIDKVRQSAERRRLATATRNYEERLHGTFGH